MSNNDYEGVTIEGKLYQPCKLCLAAFGRVRHTKWRCKECGNYMCMGEHGNFAQGSKGNKKGTCVICGERPDYRKKPEE